MKQNAWEDAIEAFEKGERSFRSAGALPQPIPVLCQRGQVSVKQGQIDVAEGIWTGVEHIATELKVSSRLIAKEMEAFQTLLNDAKK